LVVIALVSGTVGVLWQAREAQKQRDAAQAELVRATAANEFLGFLLSVAAPPGRKFAVGDLLEQGEKLIDKQFSSNDPMRAELLTTIGLQYMDSERWDKATPVLQRAATIANRSSDPAVRARARCPLALLTMLRGERRKAEVMVGQALADLPDQPQYALQRAICLTCSAEFGFATDEAQPMIRNATAALQLLDRTPIEDNPARLDAQGALAYGYYLAHQNRKADETYTVLWKLFERTGRDRTMAAADVLNNWALVHYEGDIVRAEPLYRKCAELHRSIEGVDSITPTASFNYAGVLFQLARYKEAEPLYEETIRTAHTRQESRIEYVAMFELTDLYIETGDLERASAELAKLTLFLNDSQAYANSRRADLSYGEGRLAMARGNPALARNRFADALQHLEKVNAKVSLDVFAFIGLSRAELALGHEPAAVAAAERAMKLAESFVEKGAPSYLVGRSRSALADAQLASGQKDAARTSYKLALDELQRTLGPDHPATKNARIRASS
jgi:eukaryotic-like serine/threonine-protein kinase